MLVQIVHVGKYAACAGERKALQQSLQTDSYDEEKAANCAAL